MTRTVDDLYADDGSRVLGPAARGQPTSHGQPIAGPLAAEIAGVSGPDHVLEDLKPRGGTRPATRNPRDPEPAVRQWFTALRAEPLPNFAEVNFHVWLEGRLESLIEALRKA